MPQGEISDQPQHNAADAPDQWERAARPDIVKVMDLQQQQLARSMGEGHRIIHGVAVTPSLTLLDPQDHYHYQYP